MLGGSWGSTLALAYTEACPARVSALVLFGVTTGRHSWVDWTFRGGLARFFPQQWQALVEALPPDQRDGDIVAAYDRQLNKPDPAVRQAAAEAWCLWESATPTWPPTSDLERRFADPRFAMAFARIVTHYAHHDLWLQDGALLNGASALRGIPGLLINGRFDFRPVSRTPGC